jgi:Tfp pilus assembly protein PilV
MKTEAGFSAVELLITLFIAAIFVFTGFQLYTVVLKNGTEANQRSIASGIAYENLRRYSSQVLSPCANATPTPTPTIPGNSGLPTPSITVTIDCPFGVGGLIGRVTASVKYGPTPQKEVVHAIFVSN